MESGIGPRKSRYINQTVAVVAQQNPVWQLGSAWTHWGSLSTPQIP